MAARGRAAPRCIAYLSVRIERQSARDEARPADVILVLGAAEYRGRPSPVLRARLDHALDLYQRKLAPRILTTGGAGGDPVFTEGGVGRSYLIGHGVPSEAIIVETEGESTVQSMALAGEIMRRMGLRSVIVVSDGYHIYRVKRCCIARPERLRLAAQGAQPGAPARPLELRQASHRLSALEGRGEGIAYLLVHGGRPGGRQARRQCSGGLRRRSYPFRSASLITHSAAKAVSPVERGAPPPSTALTKSSIHG